MVMSSPMSRRIHSSPSVVSVSLTSEASSNFSDVGSDSNLAIKQQAIKNIVHNSLCTVQLGERCPECSHCYAVRTLCNHVSTCQARKCPVPRCGKYKKALAHLQKCKAPECLICAPARAEFMMNPAPPMLLLKDVVAPPPPPPPPRGEFHVALMVGQGT